MKRQRQEKGRMCERVCLCTRFFLYLPHTEYQNLYSTTKVRTFIGEVRVFWLIFTILKDLQGKDFFLV